MTTDLRFIKSDSFGSGYFSAKEVCEYLDISKNTLINYRKKGLPEFIFPNAFLKAGHWIYKTSAVKLFDRRRKTQVGRKEQKGFRYEQNYNFKPILINNLVDPFLHVNAKTLERYRGISQN